MIGRIEQQTLLNNNIMDVTYGEILQNLFLISLPGITAGIYIDCDNHPDMIPIKMIQETREWVPVWTREIK